MTTWPPLDNGVGQEKGEGWSAPKFGERLVNPVHPVPESESPPTPELSRAALTAFECSSCLEDAESWGNHRHRLVQRCKRSLRHATAAIRPLPRFVILGAQRAGTTSLYEWLCSHPQIQPARRKELHYFDLQYSCGQQCYRAQFPVARCGSISGEATPYLLFHPLAPERIARDLPSTTVLIVVLREPIERAVSHYWLERRLGVESEPLPRALDLEPLRLSGTHTLVSSGKYSLEHQHFSYVARGEYAGQLKRWFSHIGQDRFVVLGSAELFGNVSVRSDILRRLSVSISTSHVGNFPRQNSVPRSDQPKSDILTRLSRHFEPHNEELFDLIGRRLW